MFVIIKNEYADNYNKILLIGVFEAHYIYGGFAIYTWKRGVATNMSFIPDGRGEVVANLFLYLDWSL